MNFLTLKRLKSQAPSRERVKPWALFLVNFNAIISHIIPENFIEISQVVQKI